MMVSLRYGNVEARQLTVKNMDGIAHWTNGAIKGIQLPEEDRLVQWWERAVDGECEAKVGDWIVCIARSAKERKPVFLAFSNHAFRIIFRETS